MQRPEVIVNMTTAILERLDPAILGGIDYLRRPNKPTLAESYYDKRSNVHTLACLSGNYIDTKNQADRK